MLIESMKKRLLNASRKLKDEVRFFYYSKPDDARIRKRLSKMNDELTLIELVEEVDYAICYEGDFYGFKYHSIMIKDRMKFTAKLVQYNRSLKIRRLDFESE